MELRKLENALKCDDFVPPQPKVNSPGNNFLLMLIVVGLCGAIIIVAFTYARHRGMVPNYLGSALSGQQRLNQTNQLGYANLPGNRIVNASDEFDNNDENHLQNDFNRPAFV